MSTKSPSHKLSHKKKSLRKKPTKNHKTNCYIFHDHPEFKPNLSPLEVISQGAFGGTYFRPITSQITHKNYKNRYQRYFSQAELDKCKIIVAEHLTRPYDNYQTKINKYKVKCGQKLEDWEKKNWITHHDPYGWFEWYCNFYSGRRIAKEDARQIKRWQEFCGEKGRFSQRLKNMVRKKKTNPTNPEISPRIRQTLIHWAYELTNHNF